MRTSKRTGYYVLAVLLLIVGLVLLSRYQDKKRREQLQVSEALAPSPSAPEGEAKSAPSRAASPAKPPADPKLTQQEPEPQGRETQTAAPSGEFLNQNLEGIRTLEEPVHAGEGEYAYHRHYTVCYSTVAKHPVWVAYELTAAETQKRVKRKGRFRKDSAIPGMTITTKDYKRTGFDRGHLAPAADMSFDQTAMGESFFLSNVCPQFPKFNRGIWKSLEEQVRDIARRHGAVYVVTGPIIGASCSSMNGKVPIPSAFYKALLTRDHRHAVAFLMPHTQEAECDGSSSQLLSARMITVDSLERVTGLDFFPLLPDSLEVKVEAQQPDPRAWGL